METLEIKNLLPISILLLAIFLANATAKTAVIEALTSPQVHSATR